MRGLMFSRKDPEIGVVMLFDEDNFHAIHMLFVFYPIDVFWLDKNQRVVGARKNIRPFTLYIQPKVIARSIVEVVAGKGLAKVGDQLSFS
jgi:uncharacterized protein